MANAPFFLDGVVTLVDAKHIMRHLRPTSSAMALVRRRPEAEKQLALADRVVLNKVDLVTPEALEEVRAAVRATNATAELIDSQNAEVPLERLLDLNAFTSARWEMVLQQPEAALHGASVSCVCLSGATVVLPALQEWLQRLVNARHQDLFRIKGVLAVQGYGHRFVLHGIHAQLQGQFDRAWRADEERSSTLVFIGHRLIQHELQKAFDACVAAGESACAECEPGEGDSPHVAGHSDGVRRRV